MWAPRAPAAPCQAWTWWVCCLRGVAAVWTQREGPFACTLPCHADGAHDASRRATQGNRAPPTSLWGQRHWRDPTQCRARDVRLMPAGCSIGTGRCAKSTKVRKTLSWRLPAAGTLSCCRSSQRTPLEPLSRWWKGDQYQSRQSCFNQIQQLPLCIVVEHLCTATRFLMNWVGQHSVHMVGGLLENKCI